MSSEPPRYKNITTARLTEAHRPLQNGRSPQKAQSIGFVSTVKGWESIMTVAFVVSKTESRMFYDGKGISKSAITESTMGDKDP